MITPAVSLNSTQTRNPVQDARLSSTRSESPSELPQTETQSDAVLLVAQVVYVTPLSDEVAPADPSEASVSDRSLGGQDAKFAQPDPAEEAVVRELAARDREVRQHELAHKSAAGGLAGAVSFDYQRGPDGQLYAVGGEVAIRTTPASSNPAEVIAHAEQLLRAALAPAEPSTQDRQVAAQARVMLAEAQAQLASQGQQESAARPAKSEVEAEPEGPEELQKTAGAEEDSAQKTKDIQADIEAAREKSAASLSEFQQTLIDVNQRLAEVNQRLVELGVLDELYRPGTVLETSA